LHQELNTGKLSEYLEKECLILTLGLGDLFVNIKVKIPNNINSEEKEYSKI
jgi:hypothetical protein